MNQDLIRIENFERTRAEERGESVGPYHRTGPALFWERGPLQWTSEEGERYKGVLGMFERSLIKGNLRFGPLTAEEGELNKERREGEGGTEDCETSYHAL